VLLSFRFEHDRMRLRRPTELGGLLAGLLALILFVAAAVAIAAGGPSPTGPSPGLAVQAGASTTQTEASAGDGGQRSGLVVRDVRADGGGGHGHHG
jgi:hypothetical protein